MSEIKRKREVFSVRVDEVLEREFTRAVKEKGLSTCMVIESFMHGFLEGAKASPTQNVNLGNTLAPVTVNIERVTQRPRRIGGGEIGESEPEMFPCAYRSRWFQVNELPDQTCLQVCHKNGWNLKCWVLRDVPPSLKAAEHEVHLRAQHERERLRADWIQMQTNIR